MCGIAGGVWSAPERSISADVLARMTDVLRHRGPDDDGFYRSECAVADPHGMRPGVALGFRRLSIIDLELASQPLSNEDGTVWVVFNGEIYNFHALRRRLEGAGHVFRTHGDGETIVHLYEDLGVECFSHFNGMFAIAIWDARHGRLVLGRDRLGKKPLVYRCEPHRLLFASELKSLLQVPGLPRDIDPTALDHYLTYQYVPHPWTIFQGTRKVAARPLCRVRERAAGGRTVLDTRLQCAVGRGASRKRSKRCAPRWNRPSRCACRATCRSARSCPEASIRR